MRRRIFYFILAMVLVFSMSLPCFADEETAEGTTTDVVIEETETATEDTLASVDDSIASESTAEPAENESTLDVDGIKKTLTSSATLAMIGSGILSVITVVGIVASKFKSIFGLVQTLKESVTGKASKEDVDGALLGAKEELTKTFKNAYSENFTKIDSALSKCEGMMKNTEENEQKLYAMFVLFMTHCKISESAKAEILNIATGVKKYTGDVYDIVENAEESIQMAITEKQEETPDTPILDEILEEEYMELG